MATKIDFTSLESQKAAKANPISPPEPRTKYISHLHIPGIPTIGAPYRLYFIFDASSVAPAGSKADWSMDKVSINTVLTNSINESILKLPVDVMMAFAKLPPGAKAAWNNVANEIHERSDMHKKMLLMHSIELLGDLRFSVRAVAIVKPTDV